ARHPPGVAARSAGDRPGHRPADGDRAVLRDADGQRAGLEKSPDAPGVGPVRMAGQTGRRPADRLVHRCTAVFGDPDSVLAVAAVRDPDPAHRAAIARRRAEGSRRNGRRAGAVDLHLHHAAASGAADHGGDPDRDHLPAHRVRRNLRHNRRRTGTADHQHRVPDLLAGADPVRRRQRIGWRTGRGRDRQRRGLLPGQDRRPESGGLTSMARMVTTRRVWISTIAAWLFGFLIFFPILWMVLTSFKSELDAFASPPFFLFFHWTTENYATVQERSDYFHHALNSIIIAGGSVLIAMLIAVPAAWSMAFSPTKRTKDILLWMLSTKMMPPVGVLVPIYLICRNLGLLDSRTGLIIILCLGNLPIVIWMLFTYFKEIPKDILEAARMDGAPIGSELIYVMTPMAIPGLASTLLLNFILAWNEAFWTLNLSTSEAAPLTVFIASYSSPEGLFWAKLSAASTLAIAPIIILGWFTQRQLVRGLTFGAVK